MALCPLWNTPIEKWNVIEGILYIIVGIGMAIYPQLLVILFNFRNAQIEEYEYRYTQFIGIILIYIGFLHFSHGCGTFYKREILPKFLGKQATNRTDDKNDSTLVFTSITIISRSVVIPILFGIGLASIAKKYPLMEIIMIMFIIVDPIMAIITFCVQRKFESDPEQNYTFVQNYQSDDPSEL